MAGDDVLEAIDKMLLEAIERGAQSSTILNLAEARAWIRNPNQSHGARVSEK